MFTSFKVDGMWNFFGPYCKLIKKELANEAEFPQGVSLGEDGVYVCALLLKCYEQGKIVVYSDFTGYVHSARKGSLSTLLGDCGRNYADAMVYLIKYIHGLKKAPITNFNFMAYRRFQAALNIHLRRHPLLWVRGERKDLAYYRRNVPINWKALSPTESPIVIFLLRNRFYHAYGLYRYIKR